MPRASLFIIAATLSAVGLPESAILIIFPVDAFFDMVRSITNALINVLSTAVVDKWEKKSLHPIK